MNQTEGVEQAKAMRWVQGQIAAHPEYRHVYHTPNGGARNKVVAMQMKALGVRKGVPDLQWPLHKWQANHAPLVTAKHGLAIEMKADNGTLSDEQKDWLTFLEQQGWVCTVARSAEEAIDALRSYHAGAFDQIASWRSPPRKPTSR